MIYRKCYNERMSAIRSNCKCNYLLMFFLQRVLYREFHFFVRPFELTRQEEWKVKMVPLATRNWTFQDYLAVPLALI